MNKNKISYIVAGLLMIAVITIWYFNISLTSLPTTFSEMVKKQIAQDQQITDFDFDKIQTIRIEKPYTSPDEDEVIIIDDQNDINGLLNTKLRVYKGGRFKDSREEYDLYIHVNGSIHRYTIAENYIRTYDGRYKVLDDNNEIFNYLKSIYEKE
ncbi:hypothetical protein [Ornithinibacillus sp. FSL M8-0202]|uniref:hypothetical protein n=1 Tax=Ornithinibacillus sp. FSL M8-0202 TaxID=2921616 RepID=UPI0030D0D1F7